MTIRRTKRIKSKSSSKNKEVRRLEKENKALCDQIVSLRDGGVCQVALTFPSAKTEHKGPLQADHFIPRSFKEAHFDTSNLTWVCGNCNFLKKLQRNGVGHMIDEIVLAREGQETFDRLKRIERSHVPFKGWRQIWFFEEVNTKLREELAGLKESRGMIESADAVIADENSGERKSEPMTSTTRRAG